MRRIGGSGYRVFDLWGRPVPYSLPIARYDVSNDPLPPLCRMYESAALVDMICGKPAVLGLKRPDSLNIVYVCHDHIDVGVRSLI